MAMITWSNHNFVGGKARMLVCQKEIDRIRDEMYVIASKPRKKANPKPRKEDLKQPKKPIRAVKATIPHHILAQRVVFLAQQGKSITHIKELVKDLSLDEIQQIVLCG